MKRVKDELNSLYCAVHKVNYSPVGKCHKCDWLEIKFKQLRDEKYKDPNRKITKTDQRFLQKVYQATGQVLPQAKIPETTSSGPGSDG